MRVQLFFREFGSWKIYVTNIANEILWLCFKKRFTCITWWFVYHNMKFKKVLYDRAIICKCNVKKKQKKTNSLNIFRCLNQESVLFYKKKFLSPQSYLLLMYLFAVWCENTPGKYEHQSRISFCSSRLFEPEE